MLAAAPVWAQPPRGFQLAAQTPHFLFYSRNGERIDVHEVERALCKVQRLLGQELPGRAEYYRYGTPQEIAANLGEYASGVTLGSLRQIHTVRREFPLHEIVHLVAAQLGEPGPFFQEGLAVALRGSKWRGQALGLFFFQAEDGIRDHCVTGVQTCALPICFGRPGSPPISKPGARWRTLRPWRRMKARAQQSSTIELAMR